MDPKYRLTVFTLFFTLAIIILGLVLEVYHSSQETSIPPVVSQELKSINPDLQTKALDERKNNPPAYTLPPALNF